MEGRSRLVHKQDLVFPYISPRHECERKGCFDMNSARRKCGTIYNYGSLSDRLPDSWRLIALLYIFILQQNGFAGYALHTPRAALNFQILLGIFRSKNWNKWNNLERPLSTPMLGALFPSYCRLSWYAMLTKTRRVLRWPLRAGRLGIMQLAMFPEVGLTTPWNVIYFKRMVVLTLRKPLWMFRNMVRFALAKCIKGLGLKDEEKEWLVYLFLLLYYEKLHILLAAAIK